MRKFLYIWELWADLDREDVKTLKTQTMDTDGKWIIVRIDGKVAAISTDYKLLSEISARLASTRTKNSPLYGEISAVTVELDDVMELRRTLTWDDLMLFGTEFQKKIWKKLYDLTHGATEEKKLLSYSDFAELCNNRAGVRAVAHAIGLNPVSAVIPCHLIVPKETIDKITEIQRRAEATIFKGDDLCLTSILSDPATDFGEYALGRELKRRLILMEFE